MFAKFFCMLIVGATFADAMPQPRAFSTWGPAVYGLQLAVARNGGAYWVALRNASGEQVHLCRYPLSPELVIVGRNGRRRPPDLNPSIDESQPGAPELQDLDPGQVLVWPDPQRISSWYRTLRGGDRVVAEATVPFLGSQASCYRRKMQTTGL